MEEIDEMVLTFEEGSDEEEIGDEEIEEKRLEIMEKIQPQINSVKNAKSLCGGPFHSNVYEYIRRKAMSDTHIKLASACTYFNRPANPPLKHYNKIIFSEKGVDTLSKRVCNNKYKWEFKKWDDFEEYLINADYLDLEDDSPIVMELIKSIIFINVQEVHFPDSENLETILPFFSTLKNCKLIEFSNYNSLSPNTFIEIIERVPKLENIFVILSRPIEKNIIKSIPTLSRIDLRIRKFLSSKEISEMLDNLLGIPEFHMGFHHYNHDGEETLLNTIRLHPQYCRLFVNKFNIGISWPIFDICNYPVRGYTLIEK